MTNPGGSDPTEDADRVSSGGSEPIGPSRRRFVQTLTGGGSLLLAGCGELGSVPPSDSGPSGTTTATGKGGTENAPKTYARTFRAPTRHDPSKTAFYGWGHAGVLRNSAYAMVAMEPAGWSLRRFVRQPGVWTSGWQTPGRRTKIRYNWIEDPIQISPTEVRITVRPGATWSDGEPITGTDLAVLPVGQTLNRFFSPPAYAPGAEGPPHQVGFAFDDFEVGDRSVSYRSSTGAFDEFWDHQIAFRLGPVYPAPPPTHVEPFDAYAEAVLETARRAQAGEIFPWYTRGFGDPDRADLVEEHLGDPAYVRKFSKPEHVLATGPWDLTGTNGQEFVFEPTPTHPLSDPIDFERFVFEYTPSADRQRAALRADRFDFASARGGSPTPQTVIDSLPDTLEYLRVPSNSLGNELGVDHSHPVLGSRTVRSAIMHALDHATIAENIHRSVAVPVTTPGGDSWGATDVASRSWLEDTLTTYPTDRDTGASLMRDAGFTRAGGQWHHGDGDGGGGDAGGGDHDPIELTLPTPRETPLWEPAVASQLTEFGIPTTVRTLAPEAFQTRVTDGEFAIWAGGTSYLTSIAQDTLFFWRHAVTNRYYGLYPPEQYETGRFSRDGTPLPRTEERWQVFTVRAPPVGQPDGPLRTYHPAAKALAFETNPPPAEFRRRVKISLWLSNWLLPTIPINKQYEQHFIDAANWRWPRETSRWESFANGDVWPAGDFLGGLGLRVDPDTTKGA